MPRKQSIGREYNFADAELYVQCMDRIKNAYTDLKQFNSYGYDLERLKAFKRLCERFRDLPDDNELVGNQMITTEKKQKAANRLRTAIRTIMTRVATKYSIRSGRYRKFGVSRMSDMTDPQLLFCGRRVSRVTRRELNFLIDAGVKENHIKQLLEACADFENAMNIQQDKVSERDIAVEKRANEGNKMYTELVTLCNIGKDIWQNVDNNKYNNYAIYESNNEQKKALKERKQAAGKLKKNDQEASTSTTQLLNKKF